MNWGTQMTDKTPFSQDDPLEKLLADARDDVPDLPPALAARILADARAHQPSPARGAGWRPWGIVGALGGWPAMAGLAAASMAGVWIGVAQPDLVLGPSDAMFDLTDLMPGYAEALAY